MFYGQQADKLTIDEASESFDHIKHLYTDYTYYFLTFDGEEGQRVTTRIDDGAPSLTLSSFDDYYFNEIDRENTLHTGRAWFQQNFDSNQPQIFNFSLTGMEPNSTFQLKSVVMARAYGEDVTFNASLNGQNIGIHEVRKNATSSSYYGLTGYSDIEYFDIETTDYSNTSSYAYTLSFSGDSYSDKHGLPWQTRGYFDYLAVKYKRQFNADGGQYRFRNFESLSQLVCAYEFDVAPQLVWNITDPMYPQVIPVNGVSFIENDANLNEYVAVFNGSYKKPLQTVSVANQDLHGHSTPELLVVASDELMESAQEYVDYKVEMGFDVQLTTTSQIYNEFSSGNLDISAIRDYAKILYDKDPTKFKSIALFGSTSYDYKGVVPNNNNHVPTYESIESLHNVKSYASDDFYGFLTTGDGEWRENSSGNHDMVVGVGRIAARTNQEARDFLNKLKRYENSPTSYGDWRTRIGFLADDGDNNLHVRDADR